jgi:hypothetical protein
MAHSWTTSVGIVRLQMSEEERNYRESGKTTERRFVICPTCQRPVEVEDNESVVCTACETRFAAGDATTLVEYQTAQQLAHLLQGGPPDRGMSPARRWGLTGGILTSSVLAGAIFGFNGFMVSLVIALGLVAAASARTGGGPIR